MDTPQPTRGVHQAQAPARRRGLARRAATAGFLGTFIEYYDFSVYGFLVVYLAPQFFPGGNPAASVLASLGVFAAGYFARPLGGIFFGSLGDRKGRRTALLATVVGMGASTTVMGVLPGYAQIGVAAPILLVLTRMLQGFSAGGEIVGSATFVAESSDRRPGFFQSLTPLGSSLGVAAAPAAVGLATVAVGSAEMASWGWRLPLLFSAVLTGLVLLYRLRLEDSPEFAELAASGRVEGTPVRSALRAHWRRILAVSVLVLTITCSSAVLMTYMNIYLIKIVGLPPSHVYWLSAIVLTAGATGFLAGGPAVDRFGSRTALLFGFGGCAILIYPVMLFMSTAESLLIIGLLYAVAVFFSNFSIPSVYVTFTNAFPTRVRYTGAALGFNLGSIVGGGVTPYAAAQLTELTGEARSPAWIVAACAVLGMSVVTYLAPRRTPK